MPKAVAIKTVGCKLNQYDSEVIRYLFEQAGYISRPFQSKADIYVLNTCTVTAKSDRDCRRLARQAAGRNPGATVIVTGCYAQRDPETLACLPGVSAVVGNDGKWNLPDLLNGGGRGQRVGEPLCGLPYDERPRGPAPTSIAGLGRFGTLTRAFLKIQDGCDERCAYCVVPFVRGPSRSRSLPEILSEAQQLTDSGHREIVLVGVHLGAYGKNSGCRVSSQRQVLETGSLPPLWGERKRGGVHKGVTPSLALPHQGGGELPRHPDATLRCSGRVSLAGSLRQLLALPGLGRLRLSSLEPLEVTAEIISLLAEEPKLCHHLHLPLQSGDDAVLSRMNRKCCAADYAEVVNEVVRAVPGIAIGADVIVGFPGETEEQFRNTSEFIESLPLAYLHVFSYSHRPGTAAASMPNQVPEQVKRRRCGSLRALSERKQVAFRRQLLGTRQTILIEKGDDEAGGSPGHGNSPIVAGAYSYTPLQGLTDNYVRVQVPKAPSPGNLVEVQITDVNGTSVVGQVLTD